MNWKVVFQFAERAQYVMALRYWVWPELKQMRHARQHSVCLGVWRLHQARVKP
ncbi:hypothetical protein L2750_18990 [Shewanella submarina]|uniref:Uncharacterized protein n=1 Tax=Shewanella submarina TaxID=2016376 RepID=A0ABV7GGS8_9GAMM|nr:hypothetical protein [Shewanella submarina]MCL1039213.1 hypothetical protein [Shewanella submarina]